jgi:prolyl-tRNA synthetase
MTRSFTVNPTHSGYTALLASDRGNYVAAANEAQIGDRPWTFSGASELEPQRIVAPGVVRVLEAAHLFNVTPSDFLKTLVFRTDASSPALNSGVNPNWVVAVIRGDHVVSHHKLAAAASEHFQVGLATSQKSPELLDNIPAGFLGPDVAMRYWDAVLIVDPDAAQDRPWIAGANEVNQFIRNFNWFRECGDKLADLRKTAVADIRVACEGDPSPKNDGGVLLVQH